MELPATIRDQLIDDLDEYFDAASPDAETATAYFLGQVEMYAEEAGIDDVLMELEESIDVDGGLTELFEAEVEGDAMFTYTGEEMVSLLDRLCSIDWMSPEEMED